MESPPTPVRGMAEIVRGIRKGHLVITGQTQYGKTTGALYFFLNEKLFDGRSNPTHIFLDTKHDDNILPHGFLAQNKEDLEFHLENSAKRIVYRVPKITIPELKRHLNDIVNTLFMFREEKKRKSPYLLFIDEVQMYAKKQEGHDGLLRLSTTGAGKKIYAVILGQRLQDIHEQTLSQCNLRMTYFMQEDPAYLKRRGMSDLVSWMPWLKANRYYFAYDTGAESGWRLHTPVPLPPKPIDPYDPKFAPP